MAREGDAMTIAEIAILSVLIACVVVSVCLGFFAPRVLIIFPNSPRPLGHGCRRKRKAQAMISLQVATDRVHFGNAAGQLIRKALVGCVTAGHVTADVQCGAQSRGATDVLHVHALR